MKMTTINIAYPYCTDITFNRKIKNPDDNITLGDKINQITRIPAEQKVLFTT